MQNYDPDRTAPLDEAVTREALNLGLVPVHIVCLEQDREAGGMDFNVFVSGAIPRAGDRIELENGAIVEVVRSYWRLGRVGQGRRVPALMPNVVAKRISPDSE